MLSELYIENIAIIEKASIKFKSGFNVLTGETGAGKSILIDSINAILGERTSKDIVRTGAKKASITAVFRDLSKKIKNILDEQGYPVDEGEDLILFREILSTGGTNCKIGGRPANVSTLRDLGLLLINIHGQHNTQALLSSEKHINFIDQFSDLEDEINNYNADYRQLKLIKQKLSKITIDEGEKTRKIEIITFQIDEIERANLSAEEETQLIIDQKTIHNFASINQALNTAHQAMFGGEVDESIGALSQMSIAADNLEEVTKLTGENGELSEEFKELYYEINDLSAGITNLLTEIDINPDDLNNIELRLDEIYHLKRKYGGSIEEVLKFSEEKKLELEQIQSAEKNIEDLKEEILILKKTCLEKAEEISKNRKKFGEKFCKDVGEELEYLNMPGVKISFSQEKTQLSLGGIDSIEFLIATNKGEIPKPLAKIASGGELSRIMLSIKNILSGKDLVETMIFDEIDTGVSGRAAQKVGSKLRETSLGKQVICVTHLAQIAALADNHLLIYKIIGEDRTYTEVKPLSEVERKHELARIIGGENITEMILKTAQEMLDFAHK